MKLGFNEATALECKGQSLIADLEACEKAGFDYIELRFDCIKEYLKTNTLADLTEWFKNHSLKPWAYNTLVYFNDRDAAGDKEIDDEVDFIIEVCNAIDMKMLITVPTFDIGKKSIEDIKRDAVPRLRQIAEKVGAHGIRVSLEFCGDPGCSINQFGTAYDVALATGCDNVGVTLDCFHFTALESHWEDLEKADPKKIFALHLNDCEHLPIGSRKDTDRTWPGDGCLDLDRIFSTLKKIGFDGVCTIEEFRPEYYELDHEQNVLTSYQRSKEFVSKHFALD